MALLASPLRTLNVARRTSGPAAVPRAAQPSISWRPKLAGITCSSDEDRMRSSTSRSASIVPKASSASSPDGHAGHAFLHDFCMSIPYAALALVAAAVLMALGAKQAAMSMAVGGVVVGACSALSLKQWKGEQSTTLTTLLSGGTASYLAYTCWMGFQSGVVPWLSGIMLALSGALALFCFYNVAAGGNPPPKRK